MKRSKKEEKEMPKKAEKELLLSKEYTNHDQLEKAKEICQTIAKRWKDGSMGKAVYPVLTFLKEKFFIRKAKRFGQSFSDAEALLFHWVSEIDAKVSAEMQEIRRQEKEDYFAERNKETFGDNVKVTIVEEAKKDEIQDYGTEDETEYEYISVALGNK